MKTPSTKTLKSIVVAGVGAFAAQSAVADFEYTVYDYPDPISLNGEWKFKWTADKKEADAYRWFYEEGYDYSDFDTIPVPSNWTTHGFEEPHYVDGTEAEGFYVRTFTVPEEVDGLRALLHFGGVWASAEVWLNGYNLGRHDSGFTPFGYDIRDHLKAGEENILCVRVRQRFGGNLFKYDANDDWGLPGIYRDVWMEFSPPNLYIENVEVLTEFDEFFRDADVKLRVHAFRRERDHFRAPSPPFQVRATVLDRDGEAVASETEEFTINAGHMGRDVRFRVPVKAPKHWTAETPNLYTLKIELMRDEGVVVHTWEDTLGFREISVEGGVFRINGRAVKLRGVNRHDQHPDVGRATREEHWREDILMMKEANINAVRLAHYPAAEGFVRMADELGLYVINEVPLGFGGNRFRKPIFAGGMMLRVYSTVERDRNRPSVVVWSFGNEDPLTTMHVSGVRALKGMDPSRPILLPFRAEEETPPEVDILAPHYWFTDEYDELGASARRPVITTEYTHALGRNQDFGELDDRWTALTQHPAGAGGFIWMWADIGLRREVAGREVLDPMEDKDRYTREGSELVVGKWAGPDAVYDSHGRHGTDGIVDADREPQQDYFEAKAVYAPVRVLVDRMPLTRGQTEMRVPVRNGYDFRNMSDVTFEWELFRDDEVIDSGSIQKEAPPHVTRRLVIPATAIGDDPSEAVHYVQFTIRRDDGSVMNRQSVRFDYDRTPQPAGPASPNRPSTSTRGDILTVSNGPASYEFNTRTGEISRILMGGRVVAEGMDVVVWRDATFSERNRFDTRERRYDWTTYMQGLDPELRSWNVEESDDGVSVRVSSEYRYDELNSFVADIHYRVTDTGTLRIDLEVTPDLDITELPEIGIELSAVPGAAALTWLGEGPMDSLPGRTSATYFGWWSADIGGEYAAGTKSAIEWARLGYDHGAAIHVKGVAGVRLDEHDDGGHAFRMFTHLAGAWTKNGPAERPEWHLSLTDVDPWFGRELNKWDSFKGSFELVPVE
ncbi:MAG: hypothetical protein JJU00_00150 [Opitutales bacterium]|nr:hypothetical protein [Opitutales bacterium]